MAVMDRLREQFRLQRKNGSRPAEETAGGGPGDLDRLTRGRTTEEADAARMGEKMSAQALVDMSGAGMFRGGTAGSMHGMTAERLNKATETLIRYQSGKASVDKRVIAAQNWWKLNNWQEIRKDKNAKGVTDKPGSTGWLWNAIVGKHADAIDCYPEPVILPRMSDDKEEAKRLSSIIPVVMELNDFEQTYNDCSWQKMQEGTGVYGVFWNSSKLNGLGDIDIKQVNILNLHWEPGIKDIQDSRNVFYVSYEDKAELYKMYPELEGKLKGSKFSAKQYKTDDNVDTSDKALVIDWYYKTWQDGVQVLHYCKYVDEYCLYSSEEDAPEGYYADGKYPFVLDALFPVAGSPAGYGYIDVAKDTQTDIDLLDQAMVKNACVRATPRYFSRKDAGINEEEFTDLSKPIVHTSNNLGTDMLRVIETPTMDGAVQNMRQSKIDEIKTITGNMDVNNGGVPAGVTAASAIAALKEDSGRSSKDSTKAAYRAYRQIVTMVIERIRQFYDIPRQFRILGQGQEQEFVSYDNSGLQVQEIQGMNGQTEAMRLPVFDIEVRAQRENAYTKMSQNELAIQFMQMGAFNPQLTDQILLMMEMMDFKGKDEIIQKIREQGTLQDTLMQVAQIAMMLAQKYDPQAAMMLQQVMQGISQDMGAMPAGGGAKGIAGKTAAESEMAAAHDANESGIVRNARERAANASRPD